MIFRSLARLKLLKVGPYSTKEEVKKAYTAAAKMYHPDHNPRPDAQEQFSQLGEEYRNALAKLQKEKVFSEKIEKDLFSKWRWLRWEFVGKEIIEWLINPATDVASVRFISGAYLILFLLALHWVVGILNTNTEMDILRLITEAEKTKSRLKEAIRDKNNEIILLQHRAREIKIELPEFEESEAKSLEELMEERPIIPKILKIV
eukprot:Platyproteum_vivax@DN16097_c0_g1_i1.p1